MVSSLPGGMGMSSQFVVSSFGSICGKAVLKDNNYVVSSVEGQLSE